jgi:hypothetical protein
VAHFSIGSSIFLVTTQVSAIASPSHESAWEQRWSLHFCGSVEKKVNLRYVDRVRASDEKINAQLEEFPQNFNPSTPR